MKVFTVTRAMWNKQKGQEELPLTWFYYYYMLHKKTGTPYISEENFNRQFSVYINNLIYEVRLRDPNIDIYEVLVWTIYTYFEENLP